MKSISNILLSSIGIGLMLSLMSCDKSSESNDINDLSLETRNFFSVRNGVESAANRAQGQFTAGSMDRLMAFAANSGSEGGNEGDSTWVEVPWIWETCANVTTSKNPDGSTTTIRDYGDGCEEGWSDWRYFVFGKVIDTYRFDDHHEATKYSSDYLYETNYIRHGGRFEIEGEMIEWTYNGYYRGSGSSQYDELSGKYSGRHVSDYDLEYSNGDINYGYEGSGEFLHDEKQSVTPRSRTKFSEADNFYQIEVTRPLVYSYDCQTSRNANDLTQFIFTYVLGIEVVTYRQDGKQGQFTIDYGNGECDNIIFITENGKRVRVDLSKTPISFMHR